MPKTIVQTQDIQLDLPPGGLQLNDGKVLTEVTVAYEAYGTLAADGRNAIYVCHALTGDAHAAFYHAEEDRDPGWWDELIGPGKSVDTDRYYVVCANILGGCKGTTGPCSINPETGRPYGTAFPLITVRDVVQVQKLLLDQLGVPELYAVIGGSLGGMQTLEWAVRFPDYVKRCICVASGVSLSPQALTFDIIGRSEIESDPNWAGGDYYDKSAGPAAGLSRARQIGHVTYLSSASMAIKFGRDERASPYPGQSSLFSTNFQIESYLSHQGSKFVKRFDANSYLYISRMMDMFDLVAEFGSIAEAFRDVKSKFLIVSISSDWLFPPGQQLDIVENLVAARKNVSYFQIDSAYGHDAFLLEYETLGRAVDAFLNGADPATVNGSGNLVDRDLICEMIEPETRVLDVGSGGGDMMLSLTKQRNITGICLDLGFDEIVECMSKGLPAIQLDADEGLKRIASDAFDCVLLNQTIQQLHSALDTIRHMLRIAPACVVGFPNFAYYRCRLSILLGRLPVSNTLPFEWYETPNIHLVTVDEFRQLCRQNDIHIADIRFLAETVVGRLLIALGGVNLGSERGLVKLTRA
ncbi:MAG: homoserine O-acetyltransferase [Lentisphaeria bacterium]|jgi:homoserine O-acetyltransferase|nr:homoserine O-acetyltransferase [Lentisphaeria bacterium]MDP7740393.1 homoserine O-acetyltransferase [Lentisphaeria bacterium]